MLLLILVSCFVVPPQISGRVVQTTLPPRGWNSYDCWGATNESQTLANAAYMKQHLQSHGYDYVVIDAGWFGNTSDPTIDEYGRLVPDPKKYPSTKMEEEGTNGATKSNFKPFVDKIHAMGLKFGTWNMFGIPRKAVEMKAKVKGTPYTVDQIVDKSVTCSWSKLTYGINLTHPGGDAYYKSQVELWKEWGLDFVKVDCIFAADMKLNPISLLSYHMNALFEHKDFVFSLSPGGGHDVRNQIEQVSSMVTMARMTADFWDVYNRSKVFGYPSTVVGHFALAEMWSDLIGKNGINGAWPDLDMLPFGRIGHPDGHGVPGGERMSRLTQSEQRIVMSLWVLMRSPLIMGGYLPENDKFVLDLLTNDNVLSVNQLICTVQKNKKLSTKSLYVWTAETCGSAAGGVVVGYFNVGGSSVKVDVTPTTVSKFSSCKSMMDLWTGKVSPGTASSHHVPEHDVLFVKFDGCS